MLGRLRRRLNIGPDSIRELVFGVEDGVVQNMTLIAGMVGGGLSRGVILFAASVNAVAGVLSMSMGTYLSSKAEVEVAAIHSSSREIPPEPSRRVARRDAWVMAAAYAVGSLVPALPFAVGFLGRGVALLVAVALGLAALFVLGYGKAVVSHQRRGRSGVEMLVLASVAGLIGFLVGAAARELFGLDF